MVCEHLWGYMCQDIRTMHAINVSSFPVVDEALLGLEVKPRLVHIARLLKMCKYTCCCKSA